MALSRLEGPALATRITRDRGKLSMFNCDQCRQGKQKRCEKRGFNCSEPKRARRQRATKTIISAPAPSSAANPPQLEQAVSSVVIKLSLSKLKSLDELCVRHRRITTENSPIDMEEAYNISISTEASIHRLLTELNLIQHLPYYTEVSPYSMPDILFSS
ncbi:hypothetical protein P280DRAFT_480207 [Massarina eburnea CBS 473.64]|uniref:Uncharacterized protein n=1 Tax=Massarina eburnea CBS 473.64 TaxID=1395130 RepID=A0A6A6S0W7_9PLEO|nr:hypothetical protein P280DRAFT_480207 [Massarina eburnea CBS 473.64]